MTTTNTGFEQWNTTTGSTTINDTWTIDSANITTPSFQPAMTAWPPTDTLELSGVAVKKEHFKLLKQLLEKRTKKQLNDLASALAESIGGDVKTVRTLLKLFPALLTLAEITDRLEE